MPTEKSGVKQPTHADEHPLRSELRRALPLLAPVVVMILAVWGIGVLVIHSRIDDWDLRFDRDLVDRRTPWLNTATQWATWLAETVPVIVILLLAIVLARRLTGGWRTSLFLAVAVGGEKLVYIASSTLVRRGRPPVPTLDDTYATSSFPSGHVASAITLYGAIAIAVGVWLGRRYLVALIAVMVVFASAVGFSRMYRGFHYPSDVIAGVAIGLIWLTLTRLVIGPLNADPPPREPPLVRG